MTCRERNRAILFRLLLTTTGVSLLVPLPLRAATTEEVNKALEKAKAYVYSQHKEGTWETSPKQDLKSTDKNVGSQWGGLTAISVYALLAAGESPSENKALAEGIEFLKKAKLTGSYSLGIRCQVWMLLPPTAETKALMRRDATQLQAMMKTQGVAKGFYDYDARGNSYSLSRAQYAVLGMWAAAQSGVEVSPDYWKKVETAWVGHQDPSGGWNYQKGGRDYPLTAGMTAAGVATLFVTQEFLNINAGSDCQGNVSHPALERGLKWLSDNFQQVGSEQEYEREYPFATLYAVERVGVASGYKYFGEHDWYQKGADYLVKRQRDDGSWKGSASYFGALPDTCFGILFLVRGRAPLFMNKLDPSEPTAAMQTAPAGAGAKPQPVAPKGDWNQRPRDVANLAHWVAGVAERDLNWQVVNASATLRDLHDAPILYLSGTKVPRLSDDLKKKLRDYVEGGGLILGHADCGGRAFGTAFQKLGTELFPRYEFRELPADHPIYANGVFSREKWKSKPSVLGLSNGVRELMLLLPQGDLGRAWQTRVVGGKEEAWQLGANLFFYAAERRNLRFRGESHLVLATGETQPEKTLTVARLEYPGNWDPEPGGWRRLANLLHNEEKLALKVEPVKLGAGKLSTGVARVAHLTGTAAFKLDDPSRAELRKFIEAGGTLLIDAAGGSAPFATSAEAEFKAIMPDAKPAVLPPDHALYGKGEAKAPTVSYRPYAIQKKAISGSLKTPRVQGIQRGGRVAVFFSREDLTTGLVGQPVDGVIGYEPKSATELVRRIITYAAGAPADPAARPQADKPEEPAVPF